MKERSSKFIIVLYLIGMLAFWALLIGVGEVGAVDVTLTNGFLDLSDLPFNDEFYQLHGQWASWPNVFYTPDDFRAGAVRHAPTYMTATDYQSVDFATHRISLMLPPARTMALSMRSSDFAMRLYVNGDPVIEVGVPGTTREQTVPRVDDRSTSFWTGDGVVEIIVHASNFVHREGGRPPEITLGAQQAVARHDMLARFQVALIIGMLFTAMLTHLGLYLLNRAQTAPLLFAACCLFLALRTNRLIPMLYPDYNWFVAIRIEYFCVYGAFAGFTRLMELLHPGHVNRKATLGYYAVTALCALTVVLLDSTVFSLIMPAYLVLTTAWIAYVLVVYACALRDGGLEMGLSFAGLVVLSALTVHDMLQANRLFQLSEQPLSPIGTAFFVCVHSLVIAIERQRIDRMYRQALSDRRQLAEENALLDHLNRLKAEFFSNISHEMKAPLALMSTHAQLSEHKLMHGASPAEVRENLKLISSEALRLSEIVEELLSLSRMEQDQFQMTRLNIGDVIRRVSGAYEAVALKRGNKLALDVPGDLPDVMGNAERLTQVLLNLLSNANAHTEAGFIAVTAWAAQDGVSVVVKDNGSGIAPERIPRLFERFDAEPGGIGLGLPIAKQIVEAHGGRIEVESTLGLGTSVTFTVPAMDPEQPETQQ